MAPLPSTAQKTIGVLALQGAFELHKKHIEALGAKYVEVVTTADFEKIDALILPGGESGVMLKLIEILGIKTTLTNCLNSKPCWGICAGAILLAKNVTHPTQASFGVIDIDIERNAYGRQLDSSEEQVNGNQVSFIRAPKIIKTGTNVQIMSLRENSPTWVEDRNCMVTTFHPETQDKIPPSLWHQRLINKIEILF